MHHTFDVRIWAIKPRVNKQGKTTSYGVRWLVAGKEFYESFKSRTLADGYRSELLSAQRRGEPFELTSGEPTSMRRSAHDVLWFDLACDYVDAKWAGSAATARQTTAEALIRVAPVFLKQGRGRPAAREIRSMLRGWAFNTDKRAEGLPVEVKETFEWCARNSLPISSVSDPTVLDALEKAVTTSLSGKRYAPSVARKTRSVLSNFFAYAVKRGALNKNPLPDTKWVAMPKGNRTIDPRTVPNPFQARTLLNAVRDVSAGRSGKRLEAFFGVMYHAGLRPEEAVALRREKLKLPDRGWGTIYVDYAAPHAGAHWTGTGRARELRGVKARDDDEGRAVPCSPELVDLLKKHLEKYDTGPDGLVFTGEQGGVVPKITYMRVWRAARQQVLSEEVAKTRLARRPYSLRHAAVSTWLAAGVDPATVARWAGHSVAILLETYAACLHGQDVIAQQQVEKLLGYQQPGK